MSVSITKSQLQKIIQEAVKKQLSSKPSTTKKKTLKEHSLSESEIQEIYDQLVVTMLWSSIFFGDDENDERNGEPLDRYFSSSDLNTETVGKLHNLIYAFVGAVERATGKSIVEVSQDCGKDLSDLGHDLWLTAAEHGAGFWDGDWDMHEKALVRAAKTMFGSHTPYVGDDGSIYLTRG